MSPILSKLVFHAAAGRVSLTTTINREEDYFVECTTALFRYYDHNCDVCHFDTEDGQICLSITPHGANNTIPTSEYEALSTTHPELLI